MFLWSWDRLFLPYVWDELGVYSRAALHMFHNNPSLFPESLPSDIGRGHPLILPFIHSVLFKVFGPYPFVAHFFNLMMGCAMVWVTYLTGKRYLSKNTGFVAALLLLIQPVFASQSVLLFPELPVAFFGLISIYFFLGSRLWISSLFATLALLTKESAIVLPAALIGSFISSKWIEGKFFKLSNIKPLAILIVPYLVYGIFLLIQKYQMGWYFYPLHQGLISFKPDQLFHRSTELLNFLFNKQGRWSWVSGIAVSFAAFASFRFFKIDFKLQMLTSQWKTSMALLIFVVFCSAFASLNYFLARYTLIMLPALCLLLVFSLETLAGVYLMRFIVFALLFPAQLLNYDNGTHFTDEDISYQRHVKNIQDVCWYLKDDKFRDKIIAVDFPVFFAVENADLGYFKRGELKSHFAVAFNRPELKDCDYFIYSYPGNHTEMKPDFSYMSRDTMFVNGHDTSWFYKNKLK